MIPELKQTYSSRPIDGGFELLINDQVVMVQKTDPATGADLTTETAAALAAQMVIDYQAAVDAPQVFNDPLLSGVPSVVTMRQARLALLQMGKLDEVEAAVAAGDRATRITWEFSSDVQRGNPLVSTLGTALGLTKQQLDDLFVLAATL